MDGLLVIDKPEGITSHDVVARVRRLLQTRRVGHTGTLDPFATGVMVVLVGKATRLAQFLDKDIKEYLATVRLGFETDTGDRTGIPKSEPTGGMSVQASDIEGVLPEFLGEIVQIPPMYSAKKVEGKKLYDLARKGLEVERKPVKVTITKLELAETAKLPTTVTLHVGCSAGTYVRTLAEDIGRRVGTGAHLAQLRRTASGKFTITDSIALDELERAEHPATVLRPIREAVNTLSAFELPDDRVDKTKNGMSTRDLSGRFENGQHVQMIDSNGQLVAVGYFDDAEKAVQPKVVLV